TPNKSTTPVRVPVRVRTEPASFEPVFIFFLERFGFWFTHSDTTDAFACVGDVIVNVQLNLLPDPFFGIILTGHVVQRVSVCYVQHQTFLGSVKKQNQFVFWVFARRSNCLLLNVCDGPDLRVTNIVLLQVLPITVCSVTFHSVSVSVCV